MIEQMPIAKVTIKDGLAVRTGLYAPGLPDGDHDLFCAPCDPRGGWAPSMFAEQAALNAQPAAEAVRQSTAIPAEESDEEFARQIEEMDRKPPSAEDVREAVRAGIHAALSKTADSYTSADVDEVERTPSARWTCRRLEGGISRRSENDALIDALAEIERLRAELDQRTAAVIISEGGQALACSASVAALYGTMKAEVEALRSLLHEAYKCIDGANDHQDSLLRSIDAALRGKEAGNG